MSTRSAIIAKIGDTYQGIYCHSDGYLAGVGATLLAHYTDLPKVEQLLALGDLSVLGEEIGEAHDFGENRYADSDRSRLINTWSRAYARDRGDELSKNSAATAEECANQIGHDGYIYVFENGTWSVGIDDLVFQPLLNAKEPA